MAAKKAIQEADRKHAQLVALLTKLTIGGAPRLNVASDDGMLYADTAILLFLFLEDSLLYQHVTHTNIPTCKHLP